MAKKQALGRGLGALLGGNELVQDGRNMGTPYEDHRMENPESVVADTREKNTTLVGEIASIEIDKIDPNPHQPRTIFDEESLKELSASISSNGVIQPITVSRNGNRFWLISGERRWRASQMAGLTHIPAYIIMATRGQMLEMGLIENIQREDLNAIDIAFSYKALMEVCNYKQDELADRVGKQRSTVANYLRLLKLPAEIQLAIKDGKIGMGHARAMLGLEEEQQVEMLKKILKEDWSVRDVEKAVQKLGEPQPKKNIQKSDFSPLIEEKRLQLAQKIGAQLELRANAKGKGSLVINFTSSQDLERILALLND